MRSVPTFLPRSISKVQCPRGATLICREWLRYYDLLPTRPRGSKLIQSWDAGAKPGAQNSYSACSTILQCGDDYYLVDLTRGRYDYPTLRKKAIALAERFKPDVILIEDASAGIALAQELKDLVGRPIKPIPVEQDKVGRLYVQQHKFEAGHVYFPRGAAFLTELEPELLSFPHGKTDDQVDSLDQGLAYKGSSYDRSLSWV